MITADYYIHEPSAEWVAVERWENEGGRLRQHHDRSLDSVGEEYLRRREQAFPTRRPSATNDIAHATLLASDEPNYIKGQTLIDGRQTLSGSVSAW